MLYCFAVDPLEARIGASGGEGIICTFQTVSAPYLDGMVQQCAYILSIHYIKQHQKKDAQYAYHGVDPI